MLTKRMFGIVALVLCTALTVLQARAQNAAVPVEKTSLPDTPEAFRISVRAWADKHQVKDAIVVVRRQGKILLTEELGSLKVADPQPVASLSKAITATCAATLVRDGKLSFETPLREALPHFFQKHGEPTDQRVKDITIGQLITHQAGFPARSRSGPDTELIGTKVITPFLAANLSSAPQIQPMLASSFKHMLSSNPGGAFEYGNASYLTLGAVIEEKSGRSYESYCRDAVLKPMGADATLDPKWAVLSSFGGWRISGENYLNFLEILAPRNMVLGDGVKRWSADDTERPFRPNGAVWYGLGVNMRKAGNGYNIWHAGRWSKNYAGAKGGALIDDFGAYVIRYNSGVSIFVAYRPSIKEPALVALQKSISDAASAVKNWN